jgi:hypothetical protein
MKRAIVASAAALLVALTAALPTLSNADVPPNLQSGGKHESPTVTNLKAHRGGPNTITLTWNDAAQSTYGIVSVTVRREHLRDPFRSVTLGPVQQWSDTDAVAGAFYHYTVCAHDTGDGEGCADVTYSLPR